MLVYALFLYVFSPMNLVVIGWFADFEDAISHRVHEVAIGAFFTLGFVGVVGILRRSNRATAALQAMIGLGVAGGAIAASTGFEPLVLAYVVPPFVLVALDPQWREIAWPRVRPKSTLLVLATVLLSMLSILALENFGKARDLVQGHESHWGAMAAFVITLSLLGVVAAMRPPGWRLAAWSTAAGVVVYAVVSMAFRFDASSLGFAGAATALVWVVGFVTAIAISADGDTSTPLVRPAQGALIAGVAAAVAQGTGWRVRWVRTAFAFPGVGVVAYIVLWLTIPSAAVSQGNRIAATIVWGAGAFALLLGGPMGVPLVLLGLVVYATVGRFIRRLRSEPRRALVGLAAGAGFSAAAVFAAMLWLAPSFGTPDVPHRITSVDSTYCSTCHTNPGVARGAPIIDVATHAHEGVMFQLCVSCHDHLPVSVAGSASALWDLPLETAPRRP